MKGCNVRYLPFKTYRNSGATIIRDISNLEVSMLYLAHSYRTIAERYYTKPPQNKLDIALDNMEKMLFN